MDVNALLELIGIRPREANANAGSTVGAMAGAAATGEGAMPVSTDPRFVGRPGYNPTTPPSQTDDLMSILNRNRHDPNVRREAQTQLAPMRAAHNEEVAQLTNEIQSAQQSAREAELALLNNGMEPRSAQPPGNVPVGEQYASLERSGGPLQNVGAPPSDTAALDEMLNTLMAQQPPATNPATGGIVGRDVGRIGGLPPPPETLRTLEIPVQTPPQYVNASAGANMISDQLPQGQFVNSGPFMTMEPPNPFMDLTTGYAAGPPMTPVARPAPNPAYVNNRNIQFPFTNPSAASRSQTEGMPQLAPTRDDKPLTPPSVFAPSGPLINAFMSGNMQPSASAPAPMPTIQNPLPARTPPEDVSTRLNREELARFLNASGGATPAPPAPSNPSPTVLRSALPITPTPIPPGATAMTPTPPPAPGQPIPDALREQLLAEAARIVASRKPQTLGAR